ncbi:MAG: SGNH/GDSL hydrolase family protein [Candidatus Hydrogenedentes bacterium]|nr:SGNH/GDSL hydrolase family protein [Candidatus Hydrogenedentota bacterium]
MKKTLKSCARLALFLAGFWAISAVISHVFLMRVMPGRAEEDFVLDCRDYPDRFESLILGESHTMCGLNPRILGECYNISILGQGYMVSYYSLARILDQPHERLELLILPVGRHSFTADLAHQNENFYYAANIDYLDLIRRRGHVRDHLGQCIKFQVFPYTNDVSYYVYRCQIARPPVPSYRGFTPAEGDFSKETMDEIEARDRASGHVGAGRDWWNQEVIEFFREILDACDEEGIRVALVQMPMTRVYDDAMERLVPRAEFDARVAALLADWPDVAMLDYHDAFYERNDLFRDVDHLNVTGADTITERLRADLVRLGALPDRLRPHQAGPAAP